MVSIFLLASTLFGAACAKKNPAPDQLASSPIAGVGQTTGECAPDKTNALVAEITKAENERGQLEAMAKKTPKKSNFRRLYDAEATFVAETDTKIVRLKACGIPTTTLEGLKEKVTTARAHLTYLSESFPEFK